MTKLEKLAILKAGGHGPDMVDLSEVVVMVWLEAVVLDLGNGVIAMNEDICTPAIDKLRTDMGHGRHKKEGNVQVKALPAHSRGEATVSK